jgi:hypothetical protein
MEFQKRVMACLMTLSLHLPVQILSLRHDNEIAYHIARTKEFSPVNVLRIDHVGDILVNRKSVLE